MYQAVAELSIYEIVFYFLIWIGGVVYSLYQVFLAGDYISKHNDFFDFTQGWMWLGRKYDNYDYEWNIWMPFIYTLMPWVFIQLLISQLLKHIRTPAIVIYSWYIVVTGTFLWHYCGIGGILYLLITPCFICLLTSIRSEALVYIMHIIILICHHIFMQLLRSFVDMPYNTKLMLTLAFSWSQLKGLNCSIDNIKDYKHKDLVGFLKNIIQCTAYCWYLPLLFLGPHILYYKFIKSVDGTVEKWTLSRMLLHLINLVRFMFWIFITELMFHFLYASALSYHIHAVKDLNMWAFYGMGYCMGQFFCNKYVVVYGIAGEVSRMDGIDAPPTPKCIGRIHLYSDMWKHFDRGLYEFLIRYIYAPICNFNIPLKKFVASFITFVFIYLWHGVHKYVLIWTALNFTGVIVESVAKSVGNSAIYSKWERRLLSSKNIRRFNCILAAPLLAMSAISNFYFFGGELIGHLYMHRLFHDSSPATLVLMFILYCCCQVSTEMKLIEHRQRKNNKYCKINDKKS